MPPAAVAACITDSDAFARTATSNVVELPNTEDTAADSRVSHAGRSCVSVETALLIVSSMAASVTAMPSVYGRITPKRMLHVRGVAP